MCGIEHTVGDCTLTIYSNCNFQGNYGYNRRVIASSLKGVSDRYIKGIAREIVYYVAQFFKKQKEHKLDIKVIAVNKWSYKSFGKINELYT